MVVGSCRTGFAIQVVVALEAAGSWGAVVALLVAVERVVIAAVTAMMFEMEPGMLVMAIAEWMIALR